MKLIDLHCDTASRLYYEGKPLNSNDFHVDIKKLKKASSLLQDFALFIHTASVDNPFVECVAMLHNLYQELEKNNDNIRLFMTGNDLQESMADNKTLAMISIEEGAALDGKLDNVLLFHDLGVKLITLLWNFENQIGYPHSFPRDGKHGLKDFGKDVVREMERLKMIIDVSHLSDDGFYDVAKITTKPFIASHSNARELCHQSRNLTDDMIKIIASHRGVIGINFYHAFLHDTKGKTEISDIIAHINHIVRIGGIDCVAFGSDYDGIGGELELPDISYVPLLEEALSKEGYSHEDIEKIFYKNALRVIQEICC